MSLAMFAALGAMMPHFIDRYPYGVQGRAIAHLLLTPNPVRARFAMWAENHFSTWLQKTQGPRKWDEHVRFLEEGFAPFGDLLMTSASSPSANPI